MARSAHTIPGTPWAGQLGERRSRTRGRWCSQLMDQSAASRGMQCALRAAAKADHWVSVHGCTCPRSRRNIMNDTTRVGAAGTRHGGSLASGHRTDELFAVFAGRHHCSRGNDFRSAGFSLGRRTWLRDRTGPIRRPCLRRALLHVHCVAGETTDTHAHGSQIQQQYRMSGVGFVETVGRSHEPQVTTITAPATTAVSAGGCDGLVGVVGLLRDRAHVSNAARISYSPRQ